MTTAQRDGGADWELGRAATKLVAALHSGDADAIGLALSDHAAAVGSKSTQMIAGLITPILAGQAEQKTALDTLVTTMQHIAVTVVQIAEAQKKSDARLANLEERMAASEADRADLRHMFLTYIAGSRRAELDAIKARVDALEHQSDGD